MRGVSHYIASERFEKRDTRILAAAGPVLPPLVIRFGLQCDTESLGSVRVTGSRSSILLIRSRLLNLNKR